MSDKELVKKGGNLEFDFMGDKIIISEGRDTYNDIRIRFDQLAKKARKRFLKTEFSNFDELYEYGLSCGDEIIFGVLSKVVEDIIDDGFLNINEEIFKKKYYTKKYYSYDDCFHHMVGMPYLKIEQDLDDEIEAREIRKESRSRWEGGGFGLGGAIKGAVTAGALNMASGMLHGTANLLGNIESSLEASERKEKYFEDPLLLETLAEGVEDSVKGIGLAYIDFFKDNYDNEIDVVTRDDEKESEVIFENLQKREIDTESEIGILKELIEINPYQHKVYSYILEKYGDENCEIDKIADYFGYDLSKKKEKMIRNILGEIKFDVEAQALKAKATVVEFSNKIGQRREKNKILDEIEAKLQEFDNAARTVDGVLFDTREEAERARGQISEIKKVFNQAVKNDINSLLETKLKLQNMYVEQRLKDGYIEFIDKDIDDQVAGIFTENENNVDILESAVTQSSLSEDDKKQYLKKIDVATRTVNGKVYNTKEEAVIAKKSLTYNGKLYKTQEGVEKAKKRLKIKRIISSVFYYPIFFIVLVLFSLAFLKKDLSIVCIWFSWFVTPCIWFGLLTGMFKVRLLSHSSIKKKVLFTILVIFICFIMGIIFAGVL